MEHTTIEEVVLDYAAQEGVVLTGKLGEDEIKMRDVALRLGARALQAKYAQKKHGYDGPSRPCDSCDGRQKFVQHRPKQVATLLGAITIKRAYYRCPDCKASCIPYDPQAGLGEEAVSPALAKASTLCAVHEPFETCGVMLKELTGQSLATATIHRLSGRVGTVAAEQESALAARMARWDSPEAEVRPSRLYVEVDGVMAHTDGDWHECKTVTCHWHDERGKVQSKQLTRCEKIDDFVPHVWALACRCGLEHAGEVILLGDGAKWIWDRIAPVLEPTAQIVDWYHACEHLWTCGRIVAGTSDAAAWVKPKENLLWDGDIRALVRELKDERKRTRARDKRKALRELITYLNNQDDRLDYPTFRAAGYEIGSGRVESACKNGVQVRAKRPGMQWHTQGLQSVLSLRAQWLSNDWETLWHTRPLTRAA